MRSSSRLRSYISTLIRHTLPHASDADISARLLGLFAFVGLLVLVIGWPLNSLSAQRAVRIQKGLSTARDKRMGVLNELITAVSERRLPRLPLLVIHLAVGEIYQVLCLGGSVDPARSRYTRSRAKVACTRYCSVYFLIADC